MKIDALSSQQRSLPAMGHETSGRPAAVEADFSSALSDQQGSMSREELREMLKKIDEQGARLTKTPTYDELKEWLGEDGEMVAAVAFGYTDREAQPSPRKAVEEVTEYRGTYPEE